MMEQAKTTERCADRLRRNGFEVATAADAHEAGEYIRSRIAELAPASISFGDSMTLYATGTVEWLRTQRTYPFIDTFEQGVPFRELIERRRQALLCDLFLTGANAVTLDGELHWLDMIGNRIAPIAFGPRHVILTVGRNKIVEDGDAAFRRIRETAARCMDCASPRRICNERLILHKCHPKGRITVVLIDEDLGL